MGCKRMTALRSTAFGCCVLSTMAGLVRIFWPENGFKPVINAVLVLYIITAALQGLRGIGWADLMAQTEELARSSAAQSAAESEINAYRENLTSQSAAQALQEVFAASGIEAAVSRQGQGWLITLVHPADRAKAEALLSANCGDIPYTIADGGDAP